MPQSLVVLISGGGSNLQSIIDACASGQVPARIARVISNRPGVRGLARAQAAGIAQETLNHQDFPDRESFDRALMARIDEEAPDLVVLAGFMRILTPQFVEHYLGKLVNIHPSLLPKFPGLHTHQRAIEARESHHGATVHFVTPTLDGGPAIMQDRVAIAADDTPESLAARVLEREHRLYPRAINAVLSGEIQFDAGQAWHQGRPLGPSGLALW